MSETAYAQYLDQITRAQSDITRGDILLKSARDQALTTAEFIRLDNWVKRQMSQKKGRK